MPLTRAQAYTEAGVNIDAGNSVVSRIKSIVSQTHIHGVLSDIGVRRAFQAGYVRNG